MLIPYCSCDVRYSQESNFSYLQALSEKFSSFLGGDGQITGVVWVATVGV